MGSLNLFGVPEFTRKSRIDKCQHCSVVICTRERVTAMAGKRNLIPLSILIRLMAVIQSNVCPSCKVYFTPKLLV